jgi:hypothetical protein
MEEETPEIVPTEIFKVDDQPDNSLGDLAYKTFTNNLAAIKLNNPTNGNFPNLNKAEVTEQYKYPFGMNNIIVPIEPSTKPIFNMKCIVCDQNCPFTNHFCCKKCGGTICSKCKHSSDTLKLLNTKVFYKLDDMYLYCVSCFNMYNGKHKINPNYEIVDFSWDSDAKNKQTKQNVQNLQNIETIEEIKNGYIEKLLFLQYKPGYDTNMINLEITRVLDAAVITQDEINKFLQACKITKVNVGKLEETVEYDEKDEYESYKEFGEYSNPPAYNTPNKKVSFDSELYKYPRNASNKKSNNLETEDYKMPDLNTNYSSQYAFDDDAKPLTGKKYDLDEFVTKGDLAKFKKDIQTLVDSNTDDILTELQSQYENNETQFISLEKKIELFQKTITTKLDNTLEYMKSIILQFCSANTKE